MKVRYRPGLAVLFLVLGGFLLAIGLWLTGKAAALLALGPLLLTYGGLFLFRPYLRVHEATIEVVPLLGSLRRTFEYHALRVEGRDVFAVAENGSSTKIPVSRWAANRSDWRATIEG
jgi:hypothetical protein